MSSSPLSSSIKTYVLSPGFDSLLPGLGLKWCLVEDTAEELDDEAVVSERLRFGNNGLSLLSFGAERKDSSTRSLLSFASAFSQT